MASWKVQDAKARFSEVIDAALKKGPQVITRRGVETAVLLPFEEWQRLKSGDHRTVAEILLGPGPRFENLIPDRRRYRRRKPVEFE